MQLPRIDMARDALPVLLPVLLVAAWLGGGVTADPTGTDEWLQLLALPVLLVALAALQAHQLAEPLPRMALAAAALVVLVPALQLLPIPSAWWHASTPRQLLAADLQLAGIPAPGAHWTLAPAATESALWALLPALAAFLAAWALPADRRRWLVKLVMLLVLGNILFAFFQAGLPRDSALRLYQQADAGFGGLFANTNHQATALIIGMVLAVGQAVHGWRRAQAGRARPLAWLAYAAVAVACFILVPLSTSRAGMALALPALAAAVLLSGGVPRQRRWHGKRGIAVVLVACLLAVAGLRAAMGWMAIDEVEELRHAMRATTSALASAHAPLGSGIGSFVEVFEGAAPSHFWLAYYVNHAHNEYVQWWLEAGWLGLLALAAVLAVLATAGWHVVRARARDGHAILAASCFVAICAVLAHSWADYPLRTTTLMATTAALAGLMLGALADSGRRPAPARAQGPATPT